MADIAASITEQTAILRNAVDCLDVITMDEVADRLDAIAASLPPPTPPADPPAA